MPTYTIYGDTSDRGVFSRDATYANAREGTGTTLVFNNGLNSTTEQIGQAHFVNPLDACYQYFVWFDTTSIPTSDTVTAATLSFVVSADETTSTDFTAEARLHDFGASVEASDFVAGSALGGKTLLATFATTSISVGSRQDWTSDAGFPAAVVKNSATRMVICDSLQRLNTAPTNQAEDFIINTSDATPQSSKAPRLVVVTTAASVPAAPSIVVIG